MGRTGGADRLHDMTSMHTASIISAVLTSSLAFQDTIPVNPTKTLPAFEVATVKRLRPGYRPPEGWQNKSQGRDKGRYCYDSITLKVSLQIAYNLAGYRISGPAWMETQRYAIAATLPLETSDDQVRLMFQTLLVDRFQLHTRWDRKELQVYGLVEGKKGAKLDRAIADSDHLVEMRRYGFTARNKSMSDLAGILMRWTDRPVVDMTGLTGFFNFALDWTPIKREPALFVSDPGDELASLSQIGLKAVPQKATLDFLIVDRAEKNPTEN